MPAFNSWTGVDNPTLDGQYATVTGLGAASGGDDTTSIQAKLDVGGIVRGLPGEDYIISDPLVIRSNTMLDLTGCTITLTSGSNCNMINNAAVSTVQRSLTDATISDGSTTLTSAAGSFTAADTGRSIVVVGAEDAACEDLCATMTYVNATTVTLSSPATASVSGVAARIYDRDTDITIRGGSWQYLDNGGSALNRHAIRLRRVDRLTISDLSVSSTSSNGKYAIFPADVTDCLISNIHLDTASDGVHVSGPASNVTIRDIFGVSGDDPIAVGNTDYAYNDTIGTVSGVLIDGVQASADDTFSIVKLYGAAGNNGTVGVAGGAGDHTLRNIVIRNITTVGSTNTPIISTDTDGAITDLLVSGVTCQGNSAARLFYFQSVQAAGRITIENVEVRDYRTAFGAVVQTSAASSIDTIVLRGINVTASNASVTTCHLAWLYAAVTDLLIDGCVLDTRGASAILFCESTTAIPVARVVNCRLKSNGSGTLVSTRYATSTTQLPILFVDNNRTTSTDSVIDIGGTTTVGLGSHYSTSTNFFRLRATAVAIISGDGAITHSGNPFATTAGFSVRVNHRNFRCDVVSTAVTVRANGDQAYNTNAGLACGAGPVVSNGTSWKNLYTDAIYTP